MTFPEPLKTNIENSVFIDNSVSSPTPASPSHKDKQIVFKDISNECSSKKPPNSSQLNKKSNELTKFKSNAHQIHLLAKDHQLASISLVEMAIRVFEKNGAYVTQSSLIKNAMHITDILEELAIEFPFFNEYPRDVWRIKFQGVLKSAYFYRTKDDRGKSFWSFNKERYLQRIRHNSFSKTSVMMHSNFAAKSIRNRRSIRHAKAKITIPQLIPNAVGRLTVAELTISVFLKLTSPQGYCADEVLQGIKFLFPARNTFGLYTIIEEELSRNTLYSEVSSICGIKLYKLKTTNIEKLTSEHHDLLEKCQKDTRQLDTVYGNLHGFCKRWSRIDDKGIPEEFRGETELTKFHVLMGVLLISPPGIDYTLHDLIERAALLYPNNTVPCPNKDFSRQIYVTDEIQRHTYNGKTLYYYIDPEVYSKYEARRIFLQNRLSVLNLSEKQVHYLLTGKKFMRSPADDEHKPSPATSKILANMGLGKRAKLPSFRKQKVNEIKHSSTIGTDSDDKNEQNAGSTAEGQDAQEESKQSNK